jgi:hypothetical protein
VAAADGRVFAVDRTGHCHRIVDGDRTAQDRLVETEHTDGCGWDGDLRRIFHARVHRGGLYVASRGCTRLYPVDEAGKRRCGRPPPVQQFEAPHRRTPRHVRPTQGVS